MRADTGGTSRPFGPSSRGRRLRWRSSVEAAHEVAAEPDDDLVRPPERAHHAAGGPNELAQRRSCEEGFEQGGQGVAARRHPPLGIDDVHRVENLLLLELREEIA